MKFYAQRYLEHRLHERPLVDVGADLDEEEVPALTGLADAAHLGQLGVALGQAVQAAVQGLVAVVAAHVDAAVEGRALVAAGPLPRGRLRRKKKLASFVNEKPLYCSSKTT